MIHSTDSPIVVLGGRMLAPFIQLYALYVVFHGHYSPGGGFQGGAILAASVLLMRLAAGSEMGNLQFHRKWSTTVGAFGLMIFAGTGVIALLTGGNFLDYAFLPLPGMDAATHRSLGILFVEVGVSLGVMGTLVSIYDDLLEGETE